MPQEILALIDKPILLIAILFVGALAGIMVEQFTAKQKRAKWRERNAGRWQKKGEITRVPWGQRAADRVPDSADQLRTVMASEFSVQPLLNKS